MRGAVHKKENNRSRSARGTGLETWIARLFEKDDFLKMGHAQRLQDLNLGMGWLYYGLARLIRPKQVVVIGSWRGFAPLVFAKALVDNGQGGTVNFIDPSLVDDFWKKPAAVRRHFLRYGITNIKHSCLTTQQFVKTPAYRSLTEVGIVLIDGYHTQQQARFDYAAFQKLVPPLGAILLHDSCKIKRTRLYGTGQVYRQTVKFFVDKLKKNPQLQVLDFPFEGGLTLIRKKRNKRAQHV